MNVDLHYMQADAAPKAMPASSQETKAHGAVKPNGCTPQCSEDISRSLALRGNSGDPAAQENGCPGRTPKQGTRTGQPAKLGAAWGSCVCNLCNTGALGDERHMLLECPALADLRLQFSSLLLSCSSVIALMSHCPTQTLFHPISLAGCQG